jgi:hypothetical protein
MNNLKKYVFHFNEEFIWECEAKTEYSAWEKFKTIKNMPVSDLQKLFKIKLKK